MMPSSLTSAGAAIRPPSSVRRLRSRLHRACEQVKRLLLPLFPQMGDDLIDVGSGRCPQQRIDHARSRPQAPDRHEVVIVLDRHPKHALAVAGEIPRGPPAQPARRARQGRSSSATCSSRWGVSVSASSAEIPCGAEPHSQRWRTRPGDGLRVSSARPGTATVRSMAGSETRTSASTRERPTATRSRRSALEVDQGARARSATREPR